MSQWLLNRLFAGSDQPVPRFAFQGAINWMRALSLLSEVTCSEPLLRTKYQTVVCRTPVDNDCDTLAFECILKASHNVSALSVFSRVEDKYDIVRSAIISWYYCIYFSSQAMIFATSNAKPESHAKTDKVWHSDIVRVGRVVEPFNVYLSEIVPKKIESEIVALRDGNSFDLNNHPTSTEEAWGCVYAYLKGTAKYEQDIAEKMVRDTAQFKALGVSNFRKKAAQDLRDVQLKKRHVNFLTQAFRYRGKANYRDSIYLSYGDNRIQEIDQFIVDLENVARNFFKMAIFYVNRRVENGVWDLFITDIADNSRINIGVSLNC